MTTPLSGYARPYCHAGAAESGVGAPVRRMSAVAVMAGPAAPAMAAHLLARAILVSADALTDARAEELTTLGVLSAARGEH